MTERVRMRMRIRMQEWKIRMRMRFAFRKITFQQALQAVISFLGKVCFLYEDAQGVGEFFET